jgi:SAM-dependent methyltransferase
VSSIRDGRLLINVGCGPPNSGRLPAFFNDWRQLRVDSDTAVAPDVLADLTDLSPIESGSVDAIWAAHCIEHLYDFQVPQALAEFRRVLSAGGFACILVPDLQSIAQYVAADRMHETLYQSAAGPVTPHDIIFGFSPAIAGGRPSMAHRCGFTPSRLQQCFHGTTFGEVVLRRRSTELELAAVARVLPAPSEVERAALMSALEL